MGQRKRAIIIGGGPGGLTAAVAVRRAGFDPLVFERASEFTEAGSGFTLWPNAIAALKRLELAEAVESVGYRSDGIAMRDWRGEYLFRVDGGRRAANEAEIYGLGILRADLLDVLLTALGKDAVFPSKRCIGYRLGADCVTVFFEDGTAISGDLLIGADGLRSVIRAQVCTGSTLRDAGFIVWRGTAQFRLSDQTGLTTLGPGAQFGLFPLRGDRAFWFASMNSHAKDGRPQRGGKPELIERFAQWHDPIPEVIKATEASQIVESAIYDMDPLQRWTDGRVALLGDAAHPATPNLGQGACQAIEDAVVLGRCLGEYTEISAALAAYAERRFKRTTAITQESRRMGSLGKWENPIACWFRGLMLKSMPARMQRQQLVQLFRFDG